MTIDTKETIESLSKKADSADKADEALKFSQAALNLANVTATLAHAETLQK